MTEGFQGPFQNAISKGGSFMSTDEKGMLQSRTYTVNDIFNWIVKNRLVQKQLGMLGESCYYR